MLDVNSLIALAWPSHVHHDAARDGFRNKGRRGWASCPFTQTAFVRISSNPGFVEDAVSPAEAAAMLDELVKKTRHEFWPDDFSVVQRDRKIWSYCLGHRQVTDAYLLDLAGRKKGKLTTLDTGIASLLPDRSERSRLLELVTS